MIRLWQGDCLEKMADIPDGTVDMILCDLPYGTTACKWDVIIPFEPLWEHYERVIKPNGAIVLTASQPFTTKLINSRFKLFRYEWIWEKNIATGFMNAKKIPLKKHENILVFYKKLPVYNPQYTAGKPYNRNRKPSITPVYGKAGATETKSDGRRYPVSIIPITTEKGLHPTQKPVALMEYLIRTYTNEGDLVLDNCMGSGTTGVAAIQSGRSFIGIEKELGYFKTASNRIIEVQKTA